MKIVVVAVPRARTVCPPDMLEGRWMEVERLPITIRVAVRPGDRPMAARRTDRWMRNDWGETAPVYEMDFM